KTSWFDDSDDVSEIDFSSALFITEGQVDKKIPLHSDCFYVLHNCAGEKYRAILDSGHGIIMQVYTHGCGAGVQDLSQRAPFIFTSLSGKIVFMPWATDLLPDEIDSIKKGIMKSGIEKKNVIHFIGTISPTAQGNKECINPFLRACQENSIQFI